MERCDGGVLIYMHSARCMGFELWVDGSNKRRGYTLRMNHPVIFSTLLPSPRQRLLESSASKALGLLKSISSDLLKGATFCYIIVYDTLIYRYLLDLVAITV